MYQKTDANYIWGIKREASHFQNPAFFKIMKEPMLVEKPKIFDIKALVTDHQTDVSSDTFPKWIFNIGPFWVVGAAEKNQTKWHKYATFDACFLCFHGQNESKFCKLYRPQ